MYCLTSSHYKYYRKYRIKVKEMQYDPEVPNSDVTKPEIVSINEINSSEDDFFFRI